MGRRVSFSIPLTLGIDWREEARKFIFPTPGVTGTELKIKIDREEEAHHMDFIMRAWPILERFRGIEESGQIVESGETDSQAGDAYTRGQSAQEV